MDNILLCTSYCPYMTAIAKVRAEIKLILDASVLSYQNRIYLQIQMHSFMRKCSTSYKTRKATISPIFASLNLSRIWESISPGGCSGLFPSFRFSLCKQRRGRIFFPPSRSGKKAIGKEIGSSMNTVCTHSGASYAVWYSSY